MTQTLAQLSTAQLRQALQLREQIDSLQTQLDAILGGGKAAATTPSTKPAKAKAPAAGKAQPKGKRTLSPEARARIAAGAKARWEKIKGAATKA